MLTVALIASERIEALEAALSALKGVAAPERPLLLIDPGVTGNGRDVLRLFSQRHGATLVILNSALSLPEATELARKQTGADYVLALTCDDRVSIAGLKTLEKSLNAARPDLAVMAAGWWLTHPDRPLPGPDAKRTGAGDVAAFYPDPRRLLIHGGQCSAPDLGRDPRAAWQIWDKMIGASRQPLFHPDPVLLRRLPDHGAAATLMAVAAILNDTPERDRPATLERALPRLGDALALAPPAAARETLAAAVQFLRAMSRGLRRLACAAPAPTGSFLSAVHKRQPDAALAHLALLASARSDMQVRALAGEYGALRADLEAALPGADYLRDLHIRMRGM